jgi:hypothetical protein
MLQFIIPAVASLAGGMMSSNAAKKASSGQNALTGAMANQFMQYMPQMNADMMGMAQQTPDWIRTAYGNQKGQIQQGSNALMSSTVARLAGNGMLRSGQANNLMAGVNRGNSAAMADAYRATSQLGDQRKMGIYAQIAGSVVPGAGQALSSYGNMANMWGQQASGNYGALANLAAAYALKDYRPQTPPITGGAASPWQLTPEQMQAVGNIIWGNK